MKGIPIHCSKSRENFVTFHYRIFSTLVFQTKKARQKKGVKLHITVTKLYILYLLTLILALGPGRHQCSDVKLQSSNHIFICKDKLSINSHNEMSLKSVLLNLNTYFLFHFNFCIFLSSGSIISVLISSTMLKTLKNSIQKNLKEDLLHHHL